MIRHKIVICIKFTPNTNLLFLDSTYEPSILIANQYYIRNVSIHGGKIMVIKLNLTNAVALDFDWVERRIYWSDVTSSVSKIMRMYENGTDTQVTLFTVICRVVLVHR